jgi:hypothetical protein
MPMPSRQLLCLSVASALGCGEAARPARDGSLDVQADAAVDARAPSDGSARPRPDARVIDAASNETCARIDARPSPKATAVWFVINPLSLEGLLATDDVTGEDYSVDFMPDLLFGHDGVVTKLGGTIQFGIACHEVTSAGSLAGPCPKGVFVPAATNNASALADALDKVTYYQGTTWASLGMIEQELARRTEPTQDTIILVQDYWGDAQCELFTSGEDMQRQAVERLAAAGVRTSVVTLLWTAQQALDAEQNNEDARRKGIQLAQLGGGEAFASDQVEAIRGAIESSVNRAVSCQIRLEGELEPGLECDGEVTLGGSPLSCNDANGFRLLDANTLELTGEACDRLRQDATATLSASFPCDAFVPII